jgi:hypothetical protein
MSGARTDHCPGCGEFSFLIPLHGGKGGPLRCPLCVGAWNAEHGRKRRTGRILIRAIKAFQDAGGTIRDLDKLKNSVLFGDVDLGFDVPEVTDPLGYMADIARLDGADVDLTSELLADVLRLTHPDHHPPERQELAHQVTQGLLALQPFVFPAPKPKPTVPTSEPRDESFKVPRVTLKEPLRYPCSDCADTVPHFYCDACKAEWNKRREKECQRQNARQRAQYARRKARRWKSKACEACGIAFKVSGGSGKGKRADARFCSAKCRQKAHRKTITAKSRSTAGPLISRDTAGAAP